MNKFTLLITSFALILLSPLFAQLQIDNKGQSLLQPQAEQAPQLQAALELIPNQNQAGAMLRLTLTPPAGHKWYYAAPGIGGLPPKFEWTLPEGWQVGKPRYPVPERFEFSGLINWGYPETATLEFPLTRQENAQAGNIEVKIDALICSEEACIPTEAEAKLEALPTEEIALGEVKRPALGEIDVRWGEIKKSRLTLILPKDKAGQKVLAVLPVEKAVDVAATPKLSILADSSPLMWDIPLAKQAGEPRPLEAWLILKDQEGKQQAEYVRLVPAQ